MTNEFEQGLFQLDPEKGETTPIDMLPEKLGFVETDELRQLRTQLIEVTISGNLEETRDLTIRYHLLGSQAVNQHQGEDYLKAQIGLSIEMGLMRRDAGRMGAYIDDLNEALDYARNMDYDDVAHSLEAAKSKEMTTILTNIGKEYGFDSETWEELAGRPFDEALEAAYRYLAQAGLDAEDLLAPFIEDPTESS